ncbi:hypothetical protein B0H16DRAFT_1694265 [Mycena metata]|uniref:Uncharacterized protein n=1 Tax=Mycena metata TaxID=1033252 RepID=A0AAD7N0U2_9AGAR|nr:hypothetical protein B0H16DRAFT_1694265 [Mycena metata]
MPPPLPQSMQNGLPILKASGKLRRRTNPSETQQLQKIIVHTRTMLATPSVEHLVAVSLKTTGIDLMCDEDPTKIEVTPEDLTRARSALQWVPQVELVEGLPEEAIVTSTPDDVHHPTQGKPIRVQLRAERAAQGHQDTAGYRRECAFVAWVLLHESMHHLVREYGCAPGNKMSPPHLRSVNKSMDVVWEGAGVRMPKGESRHWLEDCLPGGCIVHPTDIPYDDPLHPDVEVPAGLALKVRLV